ncbi:TonB-dependent receptor domain-containing protein [Maribacter sp. 2307ULW6-5]|uniref:TonB-dependent receptor domain-containing protein n=1 Tax=Maribacter sp. 2307ULW6-5 TaxID=3386275 RepID=UPI0039BC4651
MRPHLFVFLVLGLFPFVRAQEVSLSGEVRDTDGAPLPFASVFLSRVSDSVLVKGTSANEDGSFLLQDLPQGLYFLNASYVGRNSEPVALDLRTDMKIGALVIDQGHETLEGVTVTASRPQVVREVDRLVFKVANTVLSQGSSWEILKQTPGVILAQDELQIRNQAATVYINDRKVQLSSEEIRNLLENHQGQHIASIEVIHNPPARYDAEGGAVLNIVTSKNISLGYKGNVTTRYTQGVFPKYYFGTNHFYKGKKLNLSANYGYAPKKQFTETRGEVNFMDNGGPFARWDYGFDRTQRSRTHAGGVVVDYTFNARNELNFTANAQLTPFSQYVNDQRTVATNAVGAVDSTFTTNSLEDEAKNNIAADLSYKHRFEKGGSLSFNAHYTYFDLQRSQEARSEYFGATGAFFRDFRFLTEARQDIDIATTQVDYNNSFNGWTLDLGAKGSFIASNSALDYFSENNGTVFVPGLSDNFNYNEAVYAGYASTTKDWEKWSIRAGLRAEHTVSTGTSAVLNTINELEYFELFPSVYVLHNINENHSLALDYSRKLQRPRYNDLNPFRTFINENNFVEGNPNLLPSFSHNLNIGYTLKQSFFFDLYYRDNGAYISTLSFQDNGNRVLRDVAQNVLGSTSYGLDFNYGTSVTNHWYLYAYVSFFHEDETFLALESPEREFTNSFNGAYVDLTNYLTLSKDGSLKAEAGIAYLSGYLEGSFIQRETTNLTLGLRKALWKDRAQISVAANDVLGRANGAVFSRYLNQDNGYLVVPETQFVRFGFTYNFGNFRLRDNERELEKEERDRLGTGQ